MYIYSVAHLSNKRKIRNVVRLAYRLSFLHVIFNKKFIAFLCFTGVRIVKLFSQHVVRNIHQLVGPLMSKTEVEVIKQGYALHKKMFY